MRLFCTTLQAANRLFLARALKRHLPRAMVVEAPHGRIAVDILESNPLRFSVVLLVSKIEGWEKFGMGLCVKPVSLALSAA